MKWIIEISGSLAERYQNTLSGVGGWREGQWLSVHGADCDVSD